MSMQYRTEETCVGSTVFFKVLMNDIIAKIKNTPSSGNMMHVGIIQGGFFVVNNGQLLF